MAEYDGEPNGMKMLGDDALLMTDYKNGLMRLDVATGTGHTLSGVALSPDERVPHLGVIRGKLRVAGALAARRQRGEGQPVLHLLWP